MSDCWEAYQTGCKAPGRCGSHCHANWTEPVDNRKRVTGYHYELWTLHSSITWWKHMKQEQKHPPDHMTRRMIAVCDETLTTWTVPVAGIRYPLSSGIWACGHQSRWFSIRQLLRYYSQCMVRWWCYWSLTGWRRNLLLRVDADDWDKKPHWLRFRQRNP